MTPPYVRRLTQHFRDIFTEFTKREGLGFNKIISYSLGVLMNTRMQAQ